MDSWSDRQVGLVWIHAITVPEKLHAGFSYPLVTLLRDLSGFTPKSTAMQSEALGLFGTPVRVFAKLLLSNADFGNPPRN